MSAPQTPLAGRRILIVEDEALVSMLLESMVEDFGGTIVGPFMQVAPAVAFVEGHAEDFDVAILDVNLNGQRSFPIAEALRARNKPFLFSTGYDERGLDEPWRSWPNVRKPFASADLERALVSAMGPERG